MLENRGGEVMILGTHTVTSQIDGNERQSALSVGRALET